MQRQSPLKNSLQISTDEGVHAADLAEQIVPGGAGLVQGLVRAQREALKGVSDFIDANVRQLEKIESSIGDADRPRWKGSIGRGLLVLVAKRATAIHATISQFEATFLQGLTASLMREPGHSTAARPTGPERVKVE